MYQLSKGKMVVDLFHITVKSNSQEHEDNFEDLVLDVFNDILNEEPLLSSLFFILFQEDRKSVKYYQTIQNTSHTLIDSSQNSEKLISRIILDDVLGKKMSPDRKALLLLEYYSLDKDTIKLAI